MAIDMPNSPTTGDVYLANNGINYEWDGTKWTVYVDPSAGQNVWERDSGNGTLSPIYNGDDVLVKNGSGNTTVTVDSDGDITTAGEVSAAGFDIDALTVLP